MAKSIAKSCPLCLSVNDPDDMLPVVMPHSTPPQSAPLFLCRLCVIQIMKSTLESDVVDPGEVFELTQEEFKPRAAPADPLPTEMSRETTATLGENQPGGSADAEPVPEVPAGRADVQSKD